MKKSEIEKTYKNHFLKYNKFTLSILRSYYLPDFESENQEVWIKIYNQMKFRLQLPFSDEKRLNIEDSKKIMNWYSTIAHNHARDMKRKIKRSPKIDSFDFHANESVEISDYNHSLDESFERILDLGKSISKENHFAVFHDFHVKGEKFKDIAKKYQMNPTTARVYSFKVMKAIKQTVEENNILMYQSLDDAVK